MPGMYLRETLAHRRERLAAQRIEAETPTLHCGPSLDFEAMDFGIVREVPVSERCGAPDCRTILRRGNQSGLCSVCESKSDEVELQAIRAAMRERKRAAHREQALRDPKHPRAVCVTTPERRQA